MKIAILITSLNTGGAERTAVALANWLANNENNEVFLINLGKNDNNYEIDEKVNFYNKSLEKGRIHSYIAVFKYLNKVKPDVLFEMLFKPLKYALIYKIFHKNSVVIGSERSNPQKYPKRYLKFLSKICPIFCDGYIFQTNMVKEMFSSSIQRKSIVIPNAISNPDVYLTKHSSTPLKQIISVARLTYQKGQDTLIKAFSKFLKIHPEYKLIIYGEGELRTELEDLIKSLNLEDKVFLPGTSNHVINEVAKSEIFVMSSRWEGMPNALLEAMAIGTPCITTSCTDLIENEKNGLQVPIDDTEKLYLAMLKLIENVNLQKEFSLEAQKVLQKHSINNIYKEYYNYFKKVYLEKKKK